MSGDLGPGETARRGGDEPIRADGRPTRVLDERCRVQKTIRLSSLLNLGPRKADFAGLPGAVATCVRSA
ncbi:hypothetical protein [Streptomyces sp. 184]|uniref:hypothetical protein n=1 Tax=Streptomyces sp. 184 TaxID=1827526 RepID=UPI003891A740